MAGISSQLSNIYFWIKVTVLLSLLSLDTFVLLISEHWIWRLYCEVASQSLKQWDSEMISGTTQDNFIGYITVIFVSAFFVAVLHEIFIFKNQKFFSSI